MVGPCSRFKGLIMGGFVSAAFVNTRLQRKCLLSNCGLQNSHVHERVLHDGANVYRHDVLLLLPVMS